MRIIFILLVGVITFAIPSNLLAYSSGKFKEDGYALDLRWQQKDKKGKQEFQVFGSVKGGAEKCNQLNIKLDFNNSKNGARIAWVQIAIKNYRGKQSKRFRGTDIVYTPKKEAKYWHLDNIYIKCLN